MRVLTQARLAPAPCLPCHRLPSPTVLSSLPSPPEAHRARAQALLLATAAAADVSCVDEFDSTQLSEAFDAAMMELQGAKGWFTQLKTSTGYHNAQSVNSCTPPTATMQWNYPAASDATGLLKRVLDSGVLKVAGVKWGGKEAAADYLTDPENPTGFWCAARHAARRNSSPPT